jgi:hypothetical protein
MKYASYFTNANASLKDSAKYPCKTDEITRPRRYWDDFKEQKRRHHGKVTDNMTLFLDYSDSQKYLDIGVRAMGGKIGAVTLAGGPMRRARKQPYVPSRGPR